MTLLNKNTPRASRFLGRSLVGLAAAATLAVGYVVLQNMNTPDPTYEELQSAVVEIASSVNLPTGRVERQQPTGNVGENAKSFVRLTTSEAADPSELFGKIAQSIERRGYKRAEGVMSNGPFTGSWDKKSVRISVYFSGGSGRGIQAIEIGIEAAPL